MPCMSPMPFCPNKTIYAAVDSGAFLPQGRNGMLKGLQGHLLPPGACLDYMHTYDG